MNGKTKAAIFDLDGTLINSTARFDRAKKLHPSQAGDEYWLCALDPDQVHLDTPIEGMAELVQQYDRNDWQIIYLTSRPTRMQGVTFGWLEAHDFPVDTAVLVTRPEEERRRTPVWKKDTILEILADNPFTDLLFLDDECSTIDLAPALREMRFQSYQIFPNALFIGKSKPKGARYEAELQERDQLVSQVKDLEEIAIGVARFLHTLPADPNKEYTRTLLEFALDAHAQKKHLPDWHALDPFYKPAVARK